MHTGIFILVPGNQLVTPWKILIFFLVILEIDG